MPKPWPVKFKFVKTASIRRIIHIAFVALACAFFVSPAKGQVKFYTQLSESNVSPRQTFQLQYIIEGSKNIGNFTLPTFYDFTVLEVFDVPLTPTINQQTLQVVDTYSKIVILTPRRTGKFTLPGATAIIDGKPMKSNKATVTVQQSGIIASGRPDINVVAESELMPGEDIETKIKRSFFMRVETNKTHCFVGEPIMAVYKLYSRLNTSSSVVKRPSLTGFSVLDMVDAYDNKPDIEMLNGLPFYVHVIRKVQLFPLQEGVFALDAAEIESTIHFIRIDKPLSDKEELRKVLSSPGNNNNANRTLRTVVDVRKTLRSDLLNISVKPLPAENQPQGFGGAVGNFSLSVQTPINTIREGDLVKIKLVVTGSGNISLLTPPNIKWPKGVDTADPIVKETINKYVYPANGTKTFEYSFAAPDTGTYTIPSAQLPFYDPIQKIYKIATSNPVALHVKPGIKTDINQVIDKDEVKSFPSTRHLYFFGAVVLIIVSWITYQAIHLRKPKPAVANTPAADEAVAGLVKESEVEETLFKAQWALERGKPQLFYHELELAIWQIIASKYNLPPSALNKNNAVMHLRAQNVEAEIVSDFSTVLDELEWALYTPDQSAHDMEKLLRRSREILNIIEKS